MVSLYGWAEKEGIKCMGTIQTTLGTNSDFSLGVLKGYVWLSKESVYAFKETICH